MDSRAPTRLLLLALSLGAVILVAALAFSQRPLREEVSLTAASPLMVSQSPLPGPAPLPVESPLVITDRATVTAAAAGADVEAAPPTYGYRVVAEYPHDPHAYTQGLQYVDGTLVEGTGLNGASSLRRVELETGEVLQSVPLSDTYFGEGIVVVDDRVLQLTWQSNVGFIYDRETFAREGEFSYPTEGWGITYDGKELIMSDGSATLYRRDVATLEEVGRIQVADRGEPVVRLNELEFIQGEIWANIWLTDRIARIDPETGAVVGWVDLAGLLSEADRAGMGDSADAVLNGIAYDVENDRLFVTGKLWPKLFEIEVVAQD